MLSRLDDIIYPNRCEVIEISASQRYIYPIFKNGSTSIIDHAIEQKYKILFNDQIKRADSIDIILRNPKQRYISGFNTFVYNTKRDNPNLDFDTIVYFAKTYLFLNRHYTPQLFWLFHLNKYLTPTIKLRLRGMDAISDYSPLNIGPDQEFVLSDSQVDEIIDDLHIKLYLELDEVLLTLLGQELTYDEIMDHIKRVHPIGFAKCIARD
jgi:hypothetical protein